MLEVPGSWILGSNTRAPCLRVKLGRTVVPCAKDFRAWLERIRADSRSYSPRSDTDDRVRLPEPGKSLGKVSG